ncbi:MAG: flagellar basal-body MS-ring/collar protein FliF [Bryobacteraceae bacterium]
MDQLKLLLERLSLRQRITIVLVAILASGGLFAVARWNKERDFHPLFREVGSQDAGAVVNRLKELNVDYRVAENGGTILVPSSRVAEVRLQLAAAGLPKSGRIGFELFDGTDFGSTEFAEQVKYHRAIEGELERSVMSLAEVESARVHVTFGKDSVFVESRQPAKASVTVKLRAGATLSPSNVTGICHLTASAVEGLLPEAVSVIDVQGNLLSKPRRPVGADGVETSDGALEFQQKMERDYLAKVHSQLDPLLGTDKYRASVSVECDFTSGEQSEETFDPGKSVMSSSQRTEEASGANAAAGLPGTASNLPRPGLRSGSGGGSGVTRRTENTSYQSSRLVKRLRLPQGAIRRLSISLLVDQAVRWEGTGPKAKMSLIPPSPERLLGIRNLISGAVGLQAQRGDQLLVETLPFESTLTQGPPEAPPSLLAPPPVAPGTMKLPEWADKLQKKVGMPVLLGMAGGVLLALLGGLGFFLVRMRTKKTKIKAGAAPAIAGGAGGKAEIAAPQGPSVESQMHAKLAENAAQQEKQELEMLNALAVPFTATKKTEVLKKHITEQAKKDPSALAHIMRTWLNEGEER